jgi:hypothetical protein
MPPSITWPNLSLEYMTRYERPIVWVLPAWAMLGDSRVRNILFMFPTPFSTGDLLWDMALL